MQLHSNGGLSREAIIMVLMRLWPRKVIYRDCLLPAVMPDRDALLEKWITETKGDLTLVERVLNHIHVPDLLLDCDDFRETTVEELRLLARAYAALLEAEIRQVAPGRSFVVDLLEDDPRIREIEGPGAKMLRMVEEADITVVCNLVRE